MKKICITIAIVTFTLLEINAMVDWEKALDNPFVRQIAQIKFMSKNDIEKAIAENRIFSSGEYEEVKKQDPGAIVNLLKKHITIDKKLLKKLYRVYKRVEDQKITRKLWHIINRLLIRYEVDHGTDQFTTRLSKQLHEDLYGHFQPIILEKAEKEEAQEQRHKIRKLKEAILREETALAETVERKKQK